MNLNRRLPLLAAIAFTWILCPSDSEARLFHRCEGVDDYERPKRTLKLWTWPIKTEWEHRHHCLPCGRKIPYKVKVITYRERYTDGTQRTWKCVVAGSEISLGK